MIVVLSLLIMLWTIVMTIWLTHAPYWTSKTHLLSPHETIGARTSTLDRGERKIPACVIQTCKSRNVPLALYNTYHANADMTRFMMHELFDDHDVRTFIKTEFNTNTLKAYDSITPGAFKADLFRLCILLRRGAFYKDINKPLLVPLEPFMGYDLVIFRDGIKSYLFQGLLGAAPNNPHIRFALERMVEDILHKRAGRDIFWPTGPGAFGYYINQSLGRDGDAEYPVGEMVHNNERIYIGQVIGNELCDAQGVPIQRGRYEGFDKIEKPNAHYSSMWPNIFQ
jgi:hypothetical protein